MIKSIWVDNFKSLVDFTIALEKFNCVVGLNGTGKSTLLQALDFLSQLMAGDMTSWLEARHWDSADLNSKFTKRSNIDFKIVFDIDEGCVEWSGSFNRTSMKCTKEQILKNGSRILFVSDGAFSYQSNHKEIVFEYEGSILSRLKESQQGNTLRAVKDLVINIRSLDLISPELLRSQNRSADGRLGLGGEKLSAYLHESGSEAALKLTDELRRVYPKLANIRTKSLRSGWKQLEITEKFGDTLITSSARHINDGMLRLMAILLQLRIGNALLVFDEIENGINPELIEYLVDHLVKSDDQVMITTHSPMILNFIDDEVARKGVICLYKNNKGHTKSIKLFDIPSMSKKLQFMGPGEAFIDTDLTNLDREISELKSGEA